MTASFGSSSGWSDQPQHDLKRRQSCSACVSLTHGHESSARRDSTLGWDKCSHRDAWLSPARLWLTLTPEQPEIEDRAMTMAPKVLPVPAVLQLLGISRATLDRRLADPSSDLPRPFRHDRGKLLWLEETIVSYLRAK